MPDTTITLEIVNPGNGFPPDPNPAVPRDKVPWRMAEVKRSDLPGHPNDRRGVGHRPKKKGFFYRFTGGNTTFGHVGGPPPGPTDDGDFEFELNRGIKTIDIVFDAGTVGWEFHSVSLSVPIVQTNSLPDNIINLNNNTNDESITSGQIGMVVKKTQNPNIDTFLYLDPNWDNRR